MLQNVPIKKSSGPKPLYFVSLLTFKNKSEEHLSICFFLRRTRVAQAGPRLPRTFLCVPLSC